MPDGKISIWSVVVLIISVVIMAVGFSLGLINANATAEINACKSEIRTNTERIQNLEKQFGVIENELKHINKKLDELKNEEK